MSFTDYLILAGIAWFIVVGLIGKAVVQSDTAKKTGLGMLEKWLKK